MLRTTLLLIFMIFTPMALPVGCAPKIKVKADFDSPVPQDRLAAVAKARRTSDSTAIEPLIRMLASDDPLMRLVASDTLKLISGEDFGYNPAGSDTQRREGTERWVTWFEAQQAGASLRRADP